MIKGAGIFLFSESTKKVLLCRRSDSLCWANFGGTLEINETPYQCAVRELYEEAGLTHSIDYRIIGKKAVHVKKLSNFEYYSYVGLCSGELEAKINNESIDYGWFSYWQAPVELHFGVELSLYSPGVNLFYNKLIGNV